MNQFVRARILAKLQTTSALHIGSGTEVPLEPRQRSGWLQLLRSHDPTAAGLDESTLERDYELPSTGENDPQVRLATVCSDHLGRATIPGSSLRGLWRSACRQFDNAQVDDWFGPSAGSPDLHAGWLRVADAVVCNAPIEGSLEPWADPQRGTAVAHGIQIDAITGAVKEDFLWSYEYVPAGSCFELAIDVISRPGKDMAFGVIPDDALRRLMSILVRLGQSAEYALGHGGSKGMGRFRVLHDTVRIGLLRASDINDGSFAKAVSDRARQWFDFPPHVLSLADRSQVVTPALTMQLTFDEGLLVNEPGRVLPKRKKVSKDAEHNTTTAAHQFARDSQEGRPRVPGSSLKGVVRAHARRILLTALQQKLPNESPSALTDTIDRTMASLFGEADRRSKLAISDAHWIAAATTEKSYSMRRARVAVDRFTGGGQDGRLFDASVGLPCILSSTIETRGELEPWHRGWLLLLLRDAFDGDLAVGAWRSHGLGRFRISSLELHNYPAAPELCNGLPKSTADLMTWVRQSSEAQQWLAAFDAQIQSMAASLSGATA